MKINGLIYLLSFAGGAALLFASDLFEFREVALAMGIPLLMFGIYGFTKKSGKPKNQIPEDEERG